MVHDDIVYVLILVFAVAAGDVLRRFEEPGKKQFVATCFGIVIVYIVSGVHILHPIVLTAVNATVICYGSPRFCHVISFVFSFAYLFFFRTTTFFGVPPPPSHTNAVQMILILKMVGLAFEVHDTYEMARKVEVSHGDKEVDKVQVESNYLALLFRKVEPTFLDVFHYAFCFVGVLTGPYYKYRTYWDMLNCKVSHSRSNLWPTLNRLKWLPLYAFLFVIVSKYFPLSYAKTEEIFNERSFLYRVWYLTPLFFAFRMRFYAGFILSEATCIMAGLGSYLKDSSPKPGQGPTILESLRSEPTKEQDHYNFETVHNIDEFGSEFADVRGSLKSWNMTVQYWLAVNVHRRIPMKSLRTTVTMLVSAFWHGIHPGYYLSMLTVPFILLAEDAARKRFQHLDPGVFAIFAWFMKIQWFAYMGVSFSLLQMEAVLNYWKSIYFIGHIAIIVVYAIARLSPSKSKSI